VFSSPWKNVQVLSRFRSRIVENVGKRISKSDATLYGRKIYQMIDGYWLFVNPIILGKGIPLFTGIKDRTKLKLVTTHRFECGVTELNYIVDRP